MEPHKPLPRKARADAILSSIEAGKTLNAHEFAEHCGVSARTIYRDLQIMRDRGIPVGFDSDTKRYQIDQSLDLSDVDLTILAAGAVALREKHPEHADLIQSLLDKVSRSLEQRTGRSVDKLMDGKPTSDADPKDDPAPEWEGLLAAPVITGLLQEAANSISGSP